MYTPGQHISSTTAANDATGHSADGALIKQCIAELMYSRAVLKGQQLRLSGRAAEIGAVQVNSHD